MGEGTPHGTPFTEKVRLPCEGCIAGGSVARGYTQVSHTDILKAEGNSWSTRFAKGIRNH